jgi:hypothetical protein
MWKNPEKNGRIVRRKKPRVLNDLGENFAELSLHGAFLKGSKFFLSRLGTF